MVETEADGSGAHARGDIVELEPSNVAHGGVFVARLDGRVVFVGDAVDGERVLARITDDTHPAYWRAQTVQVIEPSPWRRDHVWAEASLERDPAERVGGAEFGHIELEHQRELKRRVVEDALERFGGLSLSVPVHPVQGDDENDGLGWRTRVRLHVQDDAIGPFAARSHHVVPVDSLPLATQALADIAPISSGRRDRLADALAGADTVDLVSPSASEPVLVMTAAGAREGRSRRGGATRRRTRTRRAPRYWVTDALGTPLVDATVTETVAGRRFRLDAAGFWQVHSGAAGVLHEAVARAVGHDAFDPGAANLDLYGGVGLLAAAIGSVAGSDVSVTTVESFAPATGHALTNLAPWPSAAAVTARVDAYLANLLASADGAERSRLSAGTVVLDPPRSGAGRGVIGAIAELHPARIVYVACDPVALARDLASLGAHGYATTEVRAFDLFPHTHHVEAVATLSR